jgi:hemolysin activation/secretion protein
LRIGEVFVRTLDVFSTEEASRGWVYQAANALHVETRPSVIQKFLLFESGDTYRPALLEETERNLRALPWIKSASVRALPAHDGVVDVEVLTEDAWSTELGLSVGGHGGTTTYGFKLSEENLMGRGRQLTIAYDKGSDRTTRLLELRVPYLFGRYWMGDLAYYTNSDGRRQRLRLARPFASFSDRWSVETLADNLRQEERIFRGGEVVSKFSREHRQLALRYGFALRATDKGARRLSAGLDWTDDEFRHLAERPGDEIPEDRQFRHLFVEYEDVANDFLKLNYVHRDLRYEDFNLGLRFAVRLGISPGMLGAPRTTELLRVEISRGLRLDASSFVRGSAALQTRWDGGPRNEILSANLNYVRKLATRPAQTLVSRLQYDQGWHLDRDVQFFADGESGLRAYRLRAFEGDKRLIWNVEHRVFSGMEILQLVSPGVAVFFDTGTAAAPGRPLRLRHLRSDVGIGLRLGITRASSNSTLRLDLAYPLNPDPRGRRGLLVSFSSGQAF